MKDASKSSVKDTKILLPGQSTPSASSNETNVFIRPMAKQTRAKQRHFGLLSAFVIIVILPIFISSWYLYERAIDQYASTVGFTVRSEDIGSASDILGGLGSSFSGGGGGGDSDILYEFIRSQPLVAAVDAELDLRNLYAANYDHDPMFGLNPESSIEDLTNYWQRIVRISYDTSSGLMELRVLAFAPEDAREVAETIFSKSIQMINDLSAIAREDGTRYAREDLDLAVERLKLRQRIIKEETAAVRKRLEEEETEK